MRFIVQTGVIKLHYFIYIISIFRDGTCRLRVCWSSDGDDLFIPSEGHIKVISTSNWTEKFLIRYEKGFLDMFCSVIYSKDYLFAVNNKDKLVCFNLITLKPVFEKDIEIVGLNA